MPEPMTVRQLDGRSLQALAHPLRVRILGSLRREGPATATILGQRLGESSGATSYHLRVLEAHGFVADEPGRGTQRERWWRAAQDATSWRATDFLDDPDELAAEQWLSGFAARTAMALIDSWQARRAEAPPVWRDAAEQSDYLMRVTPEQLRELFAEIHALVRARLEAGELASDAPDAERVRLLLYAVPEETALQ
jgi:DNA-binding transcriptional ArsR family regulator